MKFRNSEPYLENNVHKTVPAVVHGNGPSKRILNSLGNYLAKAWNTADQVHTPILISFFKKRFPGLGWGANLGSFDFVYFLIPSPYRRATSHTDFDCPTG
jgi:hypothetical protein